MTVLSFWKGSFVCNGDGPFTDVEVQAQEGPKRSQGLVGFLGGFAVSLRPCGKMLGIAWSVTEFSPIQF